MADAIPASFEVVANAITSGDFDSFRNYLRDNPGLALEEEVYDDAMETSDTGNLHMAPIIGSLLNLAAKYGRTEIARLLIEAGADVNQLETIHWHHSPADSRSALYEASWGDNKEMVDLLIQAGANVNLRSGPAATTPMEEAVNHGYAEVVASLLDAGGDINSEGSSERLLCRSIQGQHADIVELLLARAPNLNMSVRDSLLKIACQGTDVKIVQLLLEKGQYVDSAGSNADSLLTIVAGAQAKWEEFADSASSGAEKDRRTTAADKHKQIMEILVSSGSLPASPGSLEHVMSLFQACDTNQDGVISQDEFRQMLRLLDDKSWTDEQINQMLDAADLNRDGQIQFGEFAKWVFGSSDQQASPALPATSATEDGAAADAGEDGAAADAS